MSTAIKTKFPRADAIAVAREIIAALRPVTSLLIVAGSLRRRKQTVGDVEILFVPRIEIQPIDLLSQGPVNLADELLEQMLADGRLRKRLSCLGSAAWGRKNKLAMHQASGIPVDLFTASDENWFNYLVCRTGPASSNTRIASAAIDKGWKWHPYGTGFSRGGALAGEHVAHVIASEREVFEFVGLPYAEPWERI